MVQQLFKQKLYGNLSKTGLQPDIIFKDRVSKTPPYIDQSAERDISLPKKMEPEIYSAWSVRHINCLRSRRVSCIGSYLTSKSSELFDSISHDETGQKIAESIHIEAPYTNTQPLGHVIGQIHKTILWPKMTKDLYWLINI